MTRLLPAVLLIACVDNTVGVRNDPPQVTILQPAEGGGVPAGEPTALLARIADAQTDSEALQLVLTSDVDGELAFDATWDEEDEVSLAIDGLSLGTHTLELTAFDEAQASGADSVTVVAAPNQPPSFSLTAPVQDGRYAAELPLGIRLTVEDDFTPAAQIALSFDGLTGLPTNADAGGLLLAELDVDIGAVALTVTATDEHGLSSEQQLTFDVVDGDGDNDGQVAEEFGGVDCDDEQPTIGFGFDERCDGWDNDCDAVFDEDATDATLYFRDDDEDDYGDPDVSGRRCALEDGWVLDDTDCDDSNPAIYPGAPERCNRIDDDCDGTPAADEITDGDIDGAVTCEDCDDGDASFYPGANEPCDGLDQSCSGFADDGGQCPCDIDWFGSVSYLFCETAENWGNAGAACAGISGYELVTISSPVENDFLEGVTDTYPDVQWWTGFNDLDNFDTWVWADGSRVSHTKWNVANNEPNNLTGDEHCMEFGWYEDGSWNDVWCGEANNYICEAEVGPTN